MVKWGFQVINQRESGKRTEEEEEDRQRKMCHWCQKLQQEVGVEACDANLPKWNCLIPKAPNWFSIVALSICKKVVRNRYSFKSTVMMSVVEFVHAFCMTVDLDLISISSFYMWIACRVYGYSSKRNGSHGEWFGASTKSSVASFSVTARRCLHVCYHICPSPVSLSFLWGCHSTAIDDCSAG